MMRVWGSELRLDRPVHPCWIEVVDRIGASVDADGSNGLTRVSPDEAAARGLYVPPGAASIPLVAYHPDDLGPRSAWLPEGRRLPMGLDAPENGLRVLRDTTGQVIGYRCFGVVAGEDGQPHLQGAEDPCPGAYLSTTSLIDGRWPPTSPNRYFDSVSLPGFVMPGHDLDEFHVLIGDLALIEYQGAEIWAQCFDTGNAGATKIELSVGACDALGIPSNARSGGCSSGVKVTILPGSRAMYWDKGVVRPLSADQIQDAGRDAARAAGLRIGGLRCDV